MLGHYVFQRGAGFGLAFVFHGVKAQSNTGQHGFGHGTGLGNGQHSGVTQSVALFGVRWGQRIADVKGARTALPHLQVKVHQLGIPDFNPYPLTA